MICTRDIFLGSAVERKRGFRRGAVTEGAGGESSRKSIERSVRRELAAAEQP